MGTPGFMADRQQRLSGLIAQATGKAAYAGDEEEEGMDDEDDPDLAEAGIHLIKGGKKSDKLIETPVHRYA